MNKIEIYDTIVIGGSYSGLSAAMALGRSLRKVLIIDAGVPCNRQTPFSHNFITNDGIKPSEIVSKAKAEVLQYPSVAFLEDTVTAVRKTEQDFVLNTQLGNQFSGKKLIFATGIADTMPSIKGFSECWGISIVHCPYCHGYEIRNKKTAIMADGERAFHLAGMVKNLTDDLTLLVTNKTALDAAQRDTLDAQHIGIVEQSVLEIEHENGYIKNIVFEDGHTEAFEALYAALPFKQHTDLPQTLGCTLTDQGYIQVDWMQKTNIDGVFACGDNSERMRSVAMAVAAGTRAGAMVNMELVAEQF